MPGVSSDDHVDVVVIGSGIVGLAIARELALRGRTVLVLERQARPAQETSARNSGVVHSGIYYPTGSLKAVLCARGRELLYAFVRKRGLGHHRCGKLILAQDGQQGALDELRRRGLRNGILDLAWLDAGEVREIEPEVRCAAGLWCPSTGIVDVHELALAFVADLEAAGGSIAFGTTVESVAVGQCPVEIAGRSGGEQFGCRCNVLINAAGLGAVDLLKHFAGYPDSMRRRAWFAKGSYFVLTGARPFRHLVYPMPDEAGLGIHATLDLDGSTRFGPDVEWVDAPAYDVDPGRACEFHESIRTYWPGLRDGALQPGYAGVRPKLVGPGGGSADFVIEGPAEHGCQGLVNLLGIESPGLTSALAIGEHVAALCDT